MIDKDILFSQDDRFACISFLLKIVYEHKSHFGEEKSIKRAKYIRDLLVEITPYEPMDNVLITYNDGHNIYLDEFHKSKFHYYPKRKVSRNYYTIGKEILDHYDESIKSRYSFSINDYYEVIRRLVFLSLQEGNHRYAPIKNLENIPSFDKVLDLLSNELLSTSVRVYVINGYVYCTDMIYLEENAYFILEEAISKKDTKLISKISKIKGKYTEKIVTNAFVKLCETHSNVLIGGLETDVVVIYKKVLLIIEVKAIKYDIDMKENNKSERNCYKDLKKGIKQLSQRYNAVKLDRNIRTSDGKAIILTTSVDQIVIPLVITLDHLYELSELNHDEAKEITGHQ
jgi:hypothetical protein